MPFIYRRTVRFQDTDAAGVVYFANVLAMCHEAYEQSLVASGISLRPFFSNPAVAIPITHAEVDFLRPMFCGEIYAIEVRPTRLTDSRFETSYSIFSLEEANPKVGQATLVHVCIDPVSRNRVNLPAEIEAWLQQFHQA
jgi:1,4-dihydroxy-2-naphthoyl-CoA hydrolase